ncbi:RNA polymerase factor sigma-54 [Thermoflavimicrobium daqui]|uniref:RNA polymerase sigma-54 factor n=1 Tax=Thermoflavimicrobium daqui TaxID=2137476 RepID=A0A364K544_9BACL|nr:RNA polymerase factor sigma-54 [Thermoflavimicrobium daqui]RAL24482.1 RNA polymerase sigma-54 factor [Thermoflavimicrobium daqui]
MALQISFDLVQEQRMKLLMTPELRQAIQLLQYSAVELEQYIQEQANENPLLEMISSYSDELENDEAWRQRAEKWLNYISGTNYYPKRSAVNNESDFIMDMISSDSDSLYDMLIEQLSFLELDPITQKVCRFLIGNLDERGYLDIDYKSVCKRFQIDLRTWSTCLEVLHSMDPAGVGARSLSECIVIQLKRKECPNLIAITIADDYLEDVAKGKLKKIAQELQVEVSEVQDAIDLIKECNPRPGGGYAVSKPEYIYPDVIVESVDGEFSIQLDDRYHSNIKLNTQYIQLIKQAGLEQSTTSYLKKWMQSALWLMKGLEQRRDTIYRVVEAIIEKQKDFFEKGVSFIRPLTLKQIGEEVGLHESTISRATQHKYMQTPHGVFPFRFFFPSGLSTDSGMDMSMKAVKRQLQRLIHQEDKTKPLSDQKLSRLLQDKGIHISRRTVAKYREEMGIPSSTVRKRYTK